MIDKQYPFLLFVYVFILTNGNTYLNCTDPSCLNSTEKDLLIKKIDQVNDKLDAVVQIMANNSSDVAPIKNLTQGPIASSIYIPVREPKPRIGFLSPSHIFTQKFPLDFPLSFKLALSFFEDPNFFKTHPIKISNKFLLSGPPGCGKSFLVELLAQEFQLPLIYLKATDLQDPYYGESSRKVTEFFKYRDPQGRPVILFIDEIDAIASQRQSSSSQGDRSTLNALLVELQQNNYDSSIFIFVATKRREDLDQAFLNRFEGNYIDMKSMNLNERIYFIRDILSAYHIYDEAIINAAAKKSVGLSRRSLAAAIENSYAWYMHNKKRDNTNIVYTKEDLLPFIYKAQCDNKISWMTLLQKFMDKSSKGLTYTNLALSTVLISIQLASNEWLSNKAHAFLGATPLSQYFIK